MITDVIYDTEYNKEHDLRWDCFLEDGHKCIYSRIRCIECDEFTTYPCDTNVWFDFDENDKVSRCYNNLIVYFCRGCRLLR